MLLLMRRVIVMWCQGSAQHTVSTTCNCSYEQMRRDIAARTDAAYRDDPHFKRRLLAELNAEAAALYKVPHPPVLSEIAAHC